eukprot:3258439-Pyramimonas_sp.AAC.1
MPAASGRGREVDCQQDRRAAKGGLGSSTRDRLRGRSRRATTTSRARVSTRSKSSFGSSAAGAEDREAAPWQTGGSYPRIV